MGEAIGLSLIVQDILRRIGNGEDVYERNVPLVGGGLSALLRDTRVSVTEQGTTGFATVEYHATAPDAAPPGHDEGSPLKCELVPGPAWGQSLKRLLPPRDWDTLRASVYRQYEHKCGICGASGRMNCHEIWESDDLHHVSRLAGFVALCDLCHHVKHIGLAEKLARSGKLDLDHVIEHFMRVNGCTRAEFHAHRDIVMREWRARRDWTVDFGSYASKIPPGGPTDGLHQAEVGTSPSPAKLQPSTVIDRYWLYAKRRTGTYPPTTNGGKWLVFAPPSQVDAVWATIKAATEEGRLGDSAKVATARPNRNATSRDKLICVYTYDWRDKDDVGRIRQELRHLGVTRKIPYKADEDTRSGRYAVDHHKCLSRYYE